LRQRGNVIDADFEVLHFWQPPQSLKQQQILAIAGLQIDSREDDPSSKPVGADEIERFRAHRSNQTSAPGRGTFLAMIGSCRLTLAKT
jgi:hypothetical protein